MMSNLDLKRHLKQLKKCRTSNDVYVNFKKDDLIEDAIDCIEYEKERI